MLGIIVVPWHLVMIKECEEFLAVLVESFFKFQDRFITEWKFVNPSKELRDSNFVLSEMPDLQAPFIHSLYNGPQQIGEFLAQLLDLGIKWLLGKGVIQISDQVNQAFLLPAIN